MTIVEIKYVVNKEFDYMGKHYGVGDYWQPLDSKYDDLLIKQNFVREIRTEQKEDVKPVATKPTVKKRGRPRKLTREN